MTKKRKDIEKGERGKASGMSQGDDAANEMWKAAADRAIIKAARTKPVVTTDDFKVYMPDNVRTHDDRAWGQRVRQAATSGVLEDTGKRVKSTWPACHRRPLTMWHSKIYRSAFR